MCSRRCDGRVRCGSATPSAASAPKAAPLSRSLCAAERSGIGRKTSTISERLLRDRGGEVHRQCKRSSPGLRPSPQKSTHHIKAKPEGARSNKGQTPKQNERKQERHRHPGNERRLPEEAIVVVVVLFSWGGALVAFRRARGPACSSRLKAPAAIASLAECLLNHIRQFPITFEAAFLEEVLLQSSTCSLANNRVDSGDDLEEVPVLGVFGYGW